MLMACVSLLLDWQLQALVDALGACCAALHMEISMPKTKVVVVSDVPTHLPAAFTCNGHPVEQVPSFTYLGPHAHQAGVISHAIQPIKATPFLTMWQGHQPTSAFVTCCSGTVPACSMLVRFGACAVRMLLLLTMLAWRCNVCMVAVLTPNGTCVH